MSADSLHYCSRVTHWVERVEACSPGGRLQTAGSLLVFWFSGVPFLHLWRYLEVNSTWGKMKRDTFKVQLYSQNGRHTGIRLAEPNKNQNHCPRSPDLNRDLSPPRHRRVELLHSAGAPCSNAKLMIVFPRCQTLNMNISFTLTPMQIWKMHDRNISRVSVYKSLHVALICFIVLFLPSNKLPLYMLDECSMKAIKNGQNNFIVSVVQGQLNYHSVFHMWICTVVYMSVLLSMNTSAQTCMHELKKNKKQVMG